MPARLLGGGIPAAAFFYAYQLCLSLKPRSKVLLCAATNRSALVAGALLHTLYNERTSGRIEQVQPDRAKGRTRRNDRDDEGFSKNVIAQLTGTIARVTAQGNLILDVNGVGYKVSVPASVLEALPPLNAENSSSSNGGVGGGGPQITLLTHTLVREDDLSLFGFTNDEELEVFELLLTVSGIGPKVALALLSALPASDLARAAAGEDVRTLTRVPGVGAKTAQRLVLELKEKLAEVALRRRGAGAGQNGNDLLIPPPAAVAKDSAQGVAEDVISALLNLGYNKPEAARAAEAAQDEWRKKNGETGAPDLGQLLRLALDRLTRGGK
jgi:Holliday junction DNA helicase RuvA